MVDINDDVKTTVTAKQSKNSLSALTMRYLPATTAVGAMVLAGNANAAEFALDFSTLITNIGVVIAAVTAVGLSALSLALTVKSFKYVKSAF